MAKIWTNDGPVYCRIYASLDLNEIISLLDSELNILVVVHSSKKIETGYTYVYMYP